MTLFNYDDYRAFLKDYIASLPKAGRGEISRIASHLGVHSTLLSLIISGDRELSLDQAYSLSEYLQLTENETDFLSLLVQTSRAGNSRHRSFLKGKIEALRKSSQKVASNFESAKKLNSEQRAVFYSSWLYSAIRLFTSTNDKGVSLDEISEKFQISRPHAVEVTDFLVKAGLINTKKEKFTLGIQNTFLEQGSPHLLKHHSNWRIKAIQQSDTIAAEELMFTNVISLSKKDLAVIRSKITELIKQSNAIVKDSPAEDIACLNIDLFWID